MDDEISVRVHSIRPVLPDRRVTPVADELGVIYGAKPERDVLEREPVAAEFSEIALYIILSVNAAGAAAAPLVYKFFEPLVTELGERFRDRVLSINDEVQGRGEEARKYAPFAIAVGVSSNDEYPRVPVHYVFHGEMDGSELVKRLQAADKHLKTIPPELLNDAPQGPPGRFFWDSNQERWRGSISRFPEEPFGEEWFPPDLQN